MLSSLSQCRRPRPDEGPESAAQTIVGSLKACRGDYLDNSDAEAYALCAARAEAGDGAAAFDLGRLHILGYGVDRDYGRAKAWLERGAELGDLESKALLGSLVYSGRWVAKDAERGWQLLEEAAAAGNTRAMTSLAHHLHSGTAYGHEGKPNHDAARRWLSRAAAEGDRDAHARLSRYYPEAAEASSN